jgi:hypothetical protein
VAMVRHWPVCARLVAAASLPGTAAPEAVGGWKLITDSYVTQSTTKSLHTDSLLACMGRLCRSCMPHTWQQPTQPGGFSCTHLVPAVHPACLPATE